MLKIAGLSCAIGPRLQRLCLAGAVNVLSLSTAFAQYEIDVFNLTDVSGDLSVRYLSDERQDSDSSNSTSEKSSRLYEELSIRTKSYIYHPAFINIIASGGPIFQQQRESNNVESVSSQDTLFGYDVALNFLSRKPYPFRVYFSQTHPQVSTGLSSSYTTKSETFGMGGTLMKPLTPMGITWNASRNEARGEGLGASTDSTGDQASVSASLPYLGNQNVRLSLNWYENLSRSGSPGLPVQESTNEATSLKLIGNNLWGSRRQFDLRQDFSRDHNTTTSADLREVKSIRYTGKLRWIISRAFRPYATLMFKDQDRGFTWRRSTSAAFGSSYRFRNQIGLTGNINVSRDRSPDVSQDSSQLRLSTSFTRHLPIGRLGLSATANFGRRDQTSSSETSQIFDELVTLVGSTPVALREQFVLENTVVVANVDRTQTFSQDIDYRLVTVGSETTIERIIDGNILDGQEVLLDYEVRTGGTVEYQNFSQSLSATLGWSTRASLFLSVNNYATDVLSGEPTTSLNDSTRFEFGGRFDYPLPGGWSIGGDVRASKNEEEISPYVRSSFRSYLQSSRYWNTQVRVSLERNLVDYEASLEDVDQTAYTVSINSVILRGLAVNYTAFFNEDGGGTRFRETNRHSLQLNWRYRLLTFSLVARMYDSTQGEITRTDTNINMIVRRFF